ncbi:MAG: class I SAM-dependent DNA methyltransferase [FCB group bacterium]|nr:class I SAM-dependent DNA methyltransferase [FCB group bacterium]MBL7028964.1 class I SAM-dependent DNA methyltransferase [Candidatus Neomarinimicrobiota bacterium]MBL7121984.1 class I SAM-dependent DNA methyltransferase [Candidatus Neomarinimicrobiota bacterium]
MPLSWNEIKDRSLAFSKEWADESSEAAEAKSFLDDFFHVFGVHRRRVATFETKSKKIDGKDGYIDLLWRSKILIEMKSLGKDLDRAHKQALGYFPGLKDRDLPRYVLVCDFQHFRLYDLDDDTHVQFHLKDLHTHVHLFGFIAGYQSRSFGEEDPVNVKAAEHLGHLHDLLLESGYEGHELELLLVRLLFCLFAEDTGIFQPRQFIDYLEQRTAEDGSGLGSMLSQFFQVLNTPPEKRQKALDEQLDEFPYVNGRLFEESIPIAAFNSTMRETLLDSCALDWSRISPAIFGSLFQSIMDTKKRRNLGAHYTTETNILKALNPLFLDDLRTELDVTLSMKQRKKRIAALREFQKKLANIQILDPACGCGNFLVIAYRELRLLEVKVLGALLGSRVIDISEQILLDVHHFHGIEIEEFPAQIAQVAMWLMDHQMNNLVSEEFGQYFVRLPIRKSPNIIHQNALEIEWEEVVTPQNLTYIVGNPPFVGAKQMNAQQRVEVRDVFAGVKSAGLLDYVTCWYKKATEIMVANPKIHTAFVSTNSITQGEQVGVLWPELFEHNVHINFAHRTFQWSSEARGKATVHCVIIGISLEDVAQKWLYEYETVKSEPQELQVDYINAYLVNGPNVLMARRSVPICDVPVPKIGNKPIDNGEYLFKPSEKEEFLITEPQAEPYMRRWIGGREFINSVDRWCLWLGDCEPRQLKQMPNALQRVKSVRAYRQQSKSKPTQALAETPTRFHVENIPNKDCIVIPEVSSENRHYIPMGILSSDCLASNKLKVLPENNLYLLGVLTSTMHMAWTRAVSGRLESRYQYSITIVYNNYPWPEPNKTQQQRIEATTQAVLDERGKHPDSSLADLYDPHTMPPGLLKAHKALDRAVDKAYRGTKFETEAERVAFLMERYLDIAE